MPQNFDILLAMFSQSHIKHSVYLWYSLMYFCLCCTVDTLIAIVGFRFFSQGDGKNELIPSRSASFARSYISVL